MILSIILITIFILFISYFLVLYYYNNNKIVSLHTYKNENEIFSHGNSVVDNDIKYTKPIEETVTPPPPNTDLINKQNLILDAIILNLKELNSLGAIDSSLTDKINNLLPYITILISNLSDKTATITYNKEDLITLIKILINIKTDIDADMLTSHATCFNTYNKEDLITLIKLLINIKTDINADMSTSGATCFKEVFQETVANVNKNYINRGITLLNLADITDTNYKTNLMTLIYGNYKYVCEN